MTKDKIQKKKGKYKEGSEGVVKRLDQTNTVSHHTSPAGQFMCPSPCEIRLTNLNFILET